MMEAALHRAQEVLSHAREHRDEMVSYLVELASLESPTDVPASQRPVQEMLTADAPPKKPPAKAPRKKKAAKPKQRWF